MFLLCEKMFSNKVAVFYRNPTVWNFRGSFTWKNDEKAEKINTRLYSNGILAPLIMSEHKYYIQVPRVIIIVILRFFFFFLSFFSLFSGLFPKPLVIKSISILFMIKTIAVFHTVIPYNQLQFWFFPLPSNVKHELLYDFIYCSDERVCLFGFFNFIGKRLFFLPTPEYYTLFGNISTFLRFLRIFSQPNVLHSATSRPSPNLKPGLSMYVIYKIKVYAFVRFYPINTHALPACPLLKVPTKPVNISTRNPNKNKKKKCKKWNKAAYIFAAHSFTETRTRFVRTNNRPELKLISKKSRVTKQHGKRKNYVFWTFRRV